MPLMLETYKHLFPVSDLRLFLEGFRYYIKLMGLVYEEPMEVKWCSTEQDLISALRSMLDEINSTKSLVNFSKYKKTKYSLSKELHKFMKSLLLEGSNQQEQIRLTRRNMLMYYSVIDPLIKLFGFLEHAESIEHAPGIISAIVAHIEKYDSDEYGTYEDAIIAREIIRKRIKEETKQQKLSSRKVSDYIRFMKRAEYC